MVNSPATLNHSIEDRNVASTSGTPGNIVEAVNNSSNSGSYPASTSCTPHKSHTSSGTPPDRYMCVASTSGTPHNIVEEANSSSDSG